MFGKGHQANKMAKNKIKKGPKGKPKRDTAPNMFERLSNKKRFDVMGRKTKGDVRSVNKLRSAATEKVNTLIHQPTLRNSIQIGFYFPAAPIQFQDISPSLFPLLSPPLCSAKPLYS